jgi:hypothetical protein
MAINHAYDWLIEHGRVADYVLALDGADDRLIREPRKPTRFLVATCCSPGFFDLLRGHDVLIYRAQQGDEPLEPDDIPGGSTAMTRAPLVAAVLGYRDVTLFGADSCYIGSESHVYGGALPDLIRVECGGRTWVTSLGMLAQAEYLAEMLPAFPFPVKVKGDNLAAAMLA